MPLNKKPDVLPQRKCLRLKYYNYSKPGYYFVTICTQGRLNLFGQIVDGKTQLSGCGEIVHKCWMGIPDHFDGVSLDYSVIMPNHLHGIVVIDCRGLIHQTRSQGVMNHAPTQWGLMRNPKITLGKIIRHFKAKSTKLIHDQQNNNFQWQRNYYEHIIRNEASLYILREYIEYNPVHWELDEDNMDKDKL